MWLSVGLVVAVLAFGVAYGDSREWDWMLVNSGFLAMALVPLVWLVQLSIRNPLLFVGVLVPVPCLVGLGWHFVVPEGSKVVLAALPLFVLVVPALLWALMLVGFVRLAQWCRGRRTWEPLTEAWLMLMVFAPSVALAVRVPEWFELEPPWQAGCILVLGLLLSNVVAVPLRRLMLDLGRLSPAPVGGGEGGRLRRAGQQLCVVRARR